MHDLVPLPPTDPNGGTAYSATLSLIIAGVLGSSMLYLVTRRRPVAGALIVVGIYAALGAILAIVTDRIRTGAPAISDG